MKIRYFFVHKDNIVSVGKWTLLKVIFQLWVIKFYKIKTATNSACYSHEIASKAKGSEKVQPQELH